MTQVPVTVHEQALVELLPVRREIQQALCASLPPAGLLDLSELVDFFPRMDSMTDKLVAAVNAFGEEISLWGKNSDTQQLVNSAADLAQQIKALVALRHDPLLMDAHYDIRQSFMAIIDRVLRDVLDWLNRYQSIIYHPEDWQGKDAHLALVLQAEEEFDALHRLLKRKHVDLEGDTPLPAIKHDKKGFGLMSLLAAFGLGMWLGDDDDA